MIASLLRDLAKTFSSTSLDFGIKAICRAFTAKIAEFDLEDGTPRMDGRFEYDFNKKKILRGQLDFSLELPSLFIKSCFEQFF